MYCKYHEEDESEPSLCFRDQPVFQLSYLINPTRLIIASEKTNEGDDWQTLKSGQLIIAEAQDETIRLNTSDV